MEKDVLETGERQGEGILFTVQGGNPVKIGDKEIGEKMMTGPYFGNRSESAH